MDALEFLQEEFENVRRALRETLRYDFVPERSERYYTECKTRLSEIERAISGLKRTEADKIAARIRELSLLANWISLIERSHLGEFSWPFAEELDRFASALLFEEDMAGNRVGPIVHVIAAGSGYRISYESQVPAASKKRRFVIVEFPRSLKHHVLLHTLFGHELCHTAIYTSAAGGLLHSKVIPPLLNKSALRDVAAANAWLNDPKAPPDVKAILASVKAQGKTAQFTPEMLNGWRVELICDLFGLLLFGPAFLAAHRALLGSVHPKPYLLQLTHPPYALRQRLLVQAMRAKSWDKPLTSKTDKEFFEAESDLLNYLLADTYSEWASVFDDAGIAGAVKGIEDIFRMELGEGFKLPEPRTLVTLMARLRSGLPPHTAELSDQGEPILARLDIAQVLYAGWAYWLGRERLKPREPLSFFDTNRLCDLALLQQRAIDITLTGA